MHYPTAHHYHPRWRMLAAFVLALFVGAVLLTHTSAAQCVPNDIFCMSGLD